MSRCSISAQVLRFLGLTLSLLFVGCGDGKFPVRAAKGKVVCNGQPVTVGSVTFTPIAASEGSAETGKPATATVGPDGTFVLTTDHQFDGAIVGKHQVQYTAPEEEEEPDEEAAASVPEGSAAERAQALKKIRERYARAKSQCVQTAEIVVEVTDDGENDFTIELSPPPKR